MSSAAKGEAGLHWWEAAVGQAGEEPVAAEATPFQSCQASTPPGSAEPGLLRGTWAEAAACRGFGSATLVASSNRVKVQDYKTFLAFTFKLNYLSTDFGWAPVAGSILDPLPKW